ncbi:MAG TPA: hypothetical protein VK177_10185 [Flavobacteriales bacterium]|nr:hypothetical protein [Flavobacteriales bacterium]
MLPDSIPYTVKYAFRQDTAMAVMYRWENLTGKKPVIEFTRKQLLALMKKRYGKPGAGIDHRKETTRIDFDDYYSWQKRGEPRAAIFYHDSMSAGETVLTLEISFDPELKIPGLFIE